jgi:hypothetical protein
MAFPTVAVQPSPPARQARRRGSSWVRWFAAAALLYGVFYLAVGALQRSLVNNAALAELWSALLNPKWHNIAECAAIALCAVTGLLLPRFRVRFLRRAKQAIARMNSCWAVRPRRSAEPLYWERCRAS